MNNCINNATTKYICKVIRYTLDILYIAFPFINLYVGFFVDLTDGHQCSILDLNIWSAVEGIISIGVLLLFGIWLYLKSAIYKYPYLYINAIKLFAIYICNIFIIIWLVVGLSILTSSCVNYLTQNIFTFLIFSIGISLSANINCIMMVKHIDSLDEYNYNRANM